MAKPLFLRVAFLDFEASSLDAEGWPIEVGLSWIDESQEIQTFNTLIRPAPEWPEHAWSPASAAVRGIPGEHHHRMVIWDGGTSRRPIFFVRASDAVRLLR